MSQHKIYTFLLTADLGAAEAWYTKLFGRGPDNRPMGTLVQWELFNQAGVGISTDDEIARRLFNAGASARSRRQPDHPCDAAVTELSARVSKRQPL